MQTIEQLPTAELLLLQKVYQVPATTEQSILLRGINAELGTRPSFTVPTDTELDLSEQLEEEANERLSAQSEAEEANRDARDTEEELAAAEDEILKLKSRIAELEAKC